MSNYFKSSDINVYPASQRDAEYVKSKLSTEQNITDSLSYLLNRNFLLDSESFLLSLSGNYSVISKGSAIIHGYKVDVSTSTQTQINKSSLSTNDVIGLELRSTTVQNFNRIDGTDALDAGVSYYSGVEIVIRSSDDINRENFEFEEDDEIIYRLPLAIWTGTVWDNLRTYSDISLDLLQKRIYSTRLTADEILYDGTVANTRSQNNSSRKKQTLRNYLEYNIGIDDGAIV